MSFSINLSGHGADPEDVKEVFETTVRALRAIGAVSVGGSLTASEDGVAAVSLQAGEVADATEPADVSDDELEAPVGEEAPPDPAAVDAAVDDSAGSEGENP